MNEKKLRKFKLIDREGFINASSGNRALLLSEYCTNDTIEGYISTAGNLLVGRSWAAITASEFQFFEEIKEDNNMKVRKPVTATRRVTAPHKAPFTPPFTTTKPTTPEETVTMDNVLPFPTKHTTKTPMTAGTRKSLEELLERAIAYQTELAVRYHVPIGLPFPDAQILLDALNVNRKTITHFQNALKEGKED